MSVVASLSRIDASAIQAVVGQSGWVKKGGILRPSILMPGTILAMEGPQAQIVKITEVTLGDSTTVDRVKTQSLGGGKEVVKIYTLAELDLIRPLGYVVPTTPADSLHPFVEGGMYQAFPNGRLYTVQHGSLVDVFKGTRLFAASEEDRKWVPRLIPVFVPRWIPQTPAARV